MSAVTASTGVPSATTQQAGIAQELVSDAVHNATEAVEHTTWFGMRNFLAIVDSVGFTLFVVNMLKSIASVGNAAAAPECCSEQYLMAKAAANGNFREICFMSWVAGGYNLIETVVWLALGIIALLIGRTQPLQEAFRCLLKAVTNYFFAFVGLVGMFSPTWALGAVAGAGLILVSVLSSRLFDEGSNLQMVGFLAKKVDGVLSGLTTITSAIPEEHAAFVRDLGQKFGRIRQIPTYRAIAIDGDRTAITNFYRNTLKPILPYVWAHIGELWEGNLVPLGIEVMAHEQNGGTVMNEARRIYSEIETAWDGPQAANSSGVAAVAGAAVNAVVNAAEAAAVAALGAVAV